MRSLAQRSAEAAKGDQGLIHASVERVEQGTMLVDKAGATMTEVVASIRRVTDIVGEISAASNEQSMGVSQVGRSHHANGPGRQNAALVEQVRPPPTTHQRRHSKLVEAVAVFQLAPGEMGHTQAPGWAAPPQARRNLDCKPGGWATRYRRTKLRWNDAFCTSAISFFYLHCRVLPCIVRPPTRPHSRVLWPGLPAGISAGAQTTSRHGHRTVHRGLNVGGTGTASSTVLAPPA